MTHSHDAANKVSQQRPDRSLGAVVLNYNDYKSTITCVHSLLRCEPPPGHVVVVDNDSPNESFCLLTAELGGIPNVDIISSGFNGGYSFGNNIGIRHLQELGFDNVVIATSDTEAISPNLFSRLDDAIDQHVGVVAPQIIGPVGFQNPPIDSLNLKYLLDLTWIQFGMPGLLLRRGVSRALRKLYPFKTDRNRRNAIRSSMTERHARKVYMLHGAFVCLTESYLRTIGPLDERIFMFGEEDLLAWRCLEHELDQLLVEDVAVRHADDSSVNMTWGEKAQSFVFSEQKKSCRILRQEIDTKKLLRTWFRRRSTRIVHEAS